MTDRQTVQAAALMLVASLSVNLGAALAKTLFAQVGAEGVAALRTALAGLVLWLLVRPWRSGPGRPRLTRAQLGWLALYGLVLGGMNLSIYWSFQTIPIGLAVAVEIAGPLLLVLALSRKAGDFLWLALAVAGLALLVPWPGAEAQLDLRGLAFASLAGVLWAAYILLGKQVTSVGSGRAVAIGMVFACVVTLPFGVARAGAHLLTPAILPPAFAVAMMSSTLPYVLEMMALEKLPSKVFGLITSSAPAVAALAGFAVLGERLTGQQWLAVALMIGASAGCALTSRSAAPTPPAAGLPPTPVP